MTPWMWVLAIWLLAYLVGAIPFGYLVARSRGVDIFKQGSGNIGATNVARVLGKKLGLLVFVLDVGKGALPVALARAAWPVLERMNGALGEGWLEVGAGLAALLGHLFPVYLRFRGGKGVATGAGVVLVLMPLETLGALGAWVLTLMATRYVSLASLAAAFALCGLHLFLAGEVNAADPLTLFCFLACGLVVIRHRSNVGRLLQGTESQVKEATAMAHLGKVLHVLAMGLWFGSNIFFTFVVGLSLFGSFEQLGQLDKGTRPEWFPLSSAYQKHDANINGPREQGTRAAGFAVGPMFPLYFALQGLCGLVALATALGWVRSHPGERIHRWRVGVLVAGLITVLIGWPLERKVSELREPRDRLTSAYLQSTTASADAVQAMHAARAEFGRWHLYSLFANFATTLLATAGMALTARLPQNNNQADPSRP